MIQHVREPTLHAGVPNSSPNHSVHLIWLSTNFPGRQCKMPQVHESQPPMWETWRESDLLPLSSFVMWNRGCEGSLSSCACVCVSHCYFACQINNYILEKAVPNHEATNYFCKESARNYVRFCSPLPLHWDPSGGTDPARLVLGAFCFSILVINDGTALFPPCLLRLCRFLLCWHWSTRSSSFEHQRKPAYMFLSFSLWRIGNEAQRVNVVSGSVTIPTGHSLCAANVLPPAPLGSSV